MNLYEHSLGSEENEEKATAVTYDEYLELKKTYQRQIELGEVAKRLGHLPEFKTLVMEDYFVNEPHRLADLMASGRITGKAFDGCVEDIKAIAHFRKFLTTYIQRAELAANLLAGLEEAYQEALKEGLNPDSDQG